ncbi:BCCT family transporter [Limibacter armeniacum]|uniref:BCCT family transporter n=1 Tax=Limibacter armeniacum TaxID=466084 RepID=UPI002FE5C5E3
MDKRVISGALVVGISFVLAGIWQPATLLELTDHLNQVIRYNFGLFYLVLGLLLVVFCIWVAMSKYGHVKLGDADDKPEYSRLSWISMLYSAGMGAGLLQRGVQEPSYFFWYPPSEAVSVTTNAMKYVFFHWGLTAWGFYAFFGLVIGYYQFRLKQPALTSTALPKINSPRIQKYFKSGADLLAVIATLFGVTASLGLGTMQIAGGISQLYELDSFNSLAIVMIILLGTISLLSAMSGITKGIKWLSNINMTVALALMLFVLLVGNKQAVFGAFAEGTIAYVSDFFRLSIDTGFLGSDYNFVHDWTVFYWAFWLAWAPFTGVFIARISKGRTIREYVFGVLLLPTIGTLVWFAIFGGNILNILDAKSLQLEQGAFTNLYTSMFEFFQYLPFSEALNLITVFLLCTFLITSIDSATFVLGMMSSRGVNNPSGKVKLLWGIIIPAVTIICIYISGDEVLKTMSNLLVIAALPLGFLMTIMLFDFVKKIRKGK